MSRPNGPVLFGRCVFLIITTLAPDPGGNANCGGSHGEGERDPIAECASLAGVAIAASCAAPSLSSSLFVCIGHRCRLSGEVASGRACCSRELATQCKKMVAHELFSGKGKEKEILVEVVNTPSLTIKRGKEGRCSQCVLPMRWLAMRGWNGC